MNINKFKRFYISNGYNIESEVNKWLDENPDIHIINTHLMVNGTDYSICIFYKESKKGE